MVCDGTSDCPDGDDELDCDYFAPKGLLKCKHDNVYVHPREICDGIVNCLMYHDDELICESYVCPINCIMHQLRLILLYR